MTRSVLGDEINNTHTPNLGHTSAFHFEFMAGKKQHGSTFFPFNKCGADSCTLALNLQHQRVELFISLFLTGSFNPGKPIPLR